MARKLNISLKTRFALLLLGILIITIGVYSIASAHIQRETGEQKVLEEARLLSQQMAASWDYIDSVQTRINMNADGSYSFKGVYCSVAGKSIARRFTSETGCVIRYVREDPRSATDEPDAFERLALAEFRSGLTEYYAVTDYEEQPVFRYLSAITIVYGCLTCHGEPAGTYDETGFLREGMHLGDLAGAVSIIIPMEAYQSEIVARTRNDVALFGALAVLTLACTSFTINRWVVRPLRCLGNEAKRIGSGNFETPFKAINGSGEIGALAQELISMEQSLKNFYTLLETEVKDRTSDLNSANEMLKRHRDEIAEINMQLMEANHALKQENEYKSLFLATMSHELRTPLSSIISYANVLLRAGALSSEQHEIIDSIKHNSKNLLYQVDNILDAAKLEARRFEVTIETVDLVDIAALAESIISPIAKEKDIQFRMHVDNETPLLLTDPSVLHKVLLNLLSNAAKFTEPGGQIEMEMSVCRQKHALVVSVRDTGIGISLDDIDIVFERFKQVDSSPSRSHGGSGLGLSLVKEMVELLGGTVHVESEQGKGSLFVVTIPCEMVGGWQ